MRAQSSKRPGGDVPREEEGRLAVFYAQDEAGSLRSPPQSETGPANSNTASPSVNSAPRGGTVTKRPFPRPCPQSG